MLGPVVPSPVMVEVELEAFSAAVGVVVLAGVVEARGLGSILHA